MNRSQRASYRNSIKSLTRSIQVYHGLQTRKLKRSVKEIAKDFGVSPNSYRNWVKGRILPDLNNAHLIAKRLLSAGIEIDPSVRKFLRDNPFVASKTFEQPDAPKKVAAKAKSRRPKQVVKRSASEASSSLSLEKVIRGMVREEVNKAISNLNIRIDL